MDSLYNNEVHFKPDDDNQGWQFSKQSTVRTTSIFGGRTILAMGNRPQDHMDRDLLLASLLRDKRLRMFRKQCWTLPAWAPTVPEGIPVKFQDQARQLIMLGSTHQLFIERMRSSLHLAADPCKAENMLNAMEACPPRGALFSRTELDNAHPCGYARLCPWCHARSVQRLYDQLLAGRYSPEQQDGKHLIMFRTMVEDGGELDAQEVRDVRNQYRYHLRCVAHELGIEGGVILHQVTPWMPRYDRPSEKQKSFAHIFAMIGVADISGIENIGRTTRELCDNQMIGDHELMLLPGTLPEALRYLLYGTSYKFDTSRIGLLLKDPKTVLYGIQGAAALQPWFLFDEQQAWSYVAAMQGIRLYDTFGTWYPTKAEQKCCPVQTQSQSKAIDERQQMASNGNNYHKLSVAKQRRRELAVIALPFFQRFKDAGGQRLGSPALRKLLNDEGHSISDRDARWMAKHLPSMDTRDVNKRSERRCPLSLYPRQTSERQTVPVSSSELKQETTSIVSTHQDMPAVRQKAFAKWKLARGQGYDESCEEARVRVANDHLLISKENAVRDADNMGVAESDSIEVIAS